jgi:hypothetical protein
MDCFILEQISNRGMIDICARVAQLDRVTASEAAGCGFNSRRAHQSFAFVLILILILIPISPSIKAYV